MDFKAERSLQKVSSVISRARSSPVPPGQEELLVLNICPKLWRCSKGPTGWPLALLLGVTAPLLLHGLIICL